MLQASVGGKTTAGGKKSCIDCTRASSGAHSQSVEPNKSTTTETRTGQALLLHICYGGATSLGGSSISVSSKTRYSDVCSKSTMNDTVRMMRL